jgi:hypothetical protein
MNEILLVESALSSHPANYWYSSTRLAWHMHAGQASHHGGGFLPMQSPRLKSNPN